MTFRLNFRRPNSAKALQLENTQIGLCVVESRAPSINTSSRWRVRCTCGELFYLTGSQVQTLAKSNSAADYCCAACRTKRRTEASTLKLTCEGCSYPYELSRYDYERRAVPTMCGDCAQKVGRMRVRSSRKCSTCGTAGHDRQRCPDKRVANG